MQYKLKPILESEELTREDIVKQIKTLETSDIIDQDQYDFFTDLQKYFEPIEESNG